MAEGGGLSAGTVSLPVKPDTAGFAGILGKSVLSATESVSKAASERFSKIFGATTAAKAFEQNRVILSSAANVERASMKVRVAEEAQVASAAKLRIAQLKAAEAQDLFAAGSSKLVAAQERLAAAERLHATNTAKVESAGAALLPLQARLGTEQEKLTGIHERGRTALGRLGNGFKSVGGAVAGMAGPLAIAGGVATVLGVEAVKAAANFQTATTRLVTDAGESEKNLKMIQAGILKISTATGTGADEIAKGMYLVESSGFHGAAGLKVMQAAAEGAKIGGAELSTVSDALTTVMKDYGFKAGDAALATSKLIATVSTGKTTMEQLAGSLHSVLPAAEAAGISLSQVLGAVGTMTAEGISAEQATQNLNHAILSLQNPTAVQTKAMAAMGIASIDVAQNLGKRGLTGTLDLLQESILKHMGPSGLVLQNSFNQSKQAAASANAMLQHLPPSLRALGKEFLANQITQKDWTHALKDQPVLTATMGRQFAVVAKNAHGFSDALKSGSGPAKTFSAQLAQMTGGQVGLQVALHLSGIHAADFAKNVHSINGATAAAGGHVRDWATIQATFNQKMAQAKTSLQNAGIVIGTALMPAIQKLLPYIPKIAQGFAEAAPTIKSMADATVAVFKVIGPVISQIVKLTNGLGSMNGATNKTALVMQGLHGKFGPVLQVLAQLGYNLGKTIGQVINWGKSIASTFTHAWRTVTSVTSGAMKTIANVIRTAMLIIVGVFVIGWGKIAAFIAPAWNRIAGIVSAGAAVVRRVVTAAINAVWAVWSRVWSAVAGMLSPIWNRIVGAVSHGISSVMSLVGGIGGRVSGAVSNFGSILFSAGQNLIRGLMNGIGSMVAPLISTVSNIAGNAISAAKNALGIRSPSTVFHGIGIYVAQGLANGIKSGSKHVHAAIGVMSGGTVSVHAGVATSRGPQAAVGPTGVSERPIYADGTLFGWIRETAEGAAQLVVNRSAKHGAVAGMGGAR